VSLLVPLLSSRFVSRDRTIQYVPLSDALTRDWSTGAATTAYAMPAIARRLVNDELESYGGVRMVLMIFDVDDEAAHKEDRESSPEWWAIERAKIDDLFGSYPGGYVYRTRRGYRIVYVLREPFIIHDLHDARRWKASYLHAVDHLREMFALEADRACADWTRLFALPLKGRETIGDAHDVGVWGLVLIDPGPAPKRGEVTGDAADSEIGQACIARGLDGREIKGGRKLVVQCPFFDSHSGHKPLDGSTVVLAPTNNCRRGWLYCSHSHCAGREQSEFRKALGIVDDESAVVRGLRRDLATRDSDVGSTLEEIEDTTMRIIHSLPAPSRVVVVFATTGAGKSRAAILALDTASFEPGRRYVFAVPTHRLAAEITMRFAERGVDVAQRKGFLRVLGADGKPACKQTERAEQIQASGGSITSLCRTCSHRRRCAARIMPEEERVTVVPHALASVAMHARDDEDGDNAEDEPREPKILIFDECPQLTREELVTRGELTEVIEMLKDNVLEPTHVRAIGAYVHALRIAADDPAHELIAACGQADAEAEARGLEPNADAIRSGVLFFGIESVLRDDDLLLLSGVRYTATLRTMRLMRAVLAAQDVRRLVWRTDGIAVHVETAEAQLLREGNVVILDATPPLAELRAMLGDVWWVSMTAADGAPITRRILPSGEATRSRLVPGKTVAWKHVEPLVRRALDHVRDVRGRILLVTHMPIAKQMKQALEDIFAPFGDRIDVAYFGGLRGLDEFRGHEACLSIGDPWPDVRSSAEIAKIADIDPEAHARHAPRAELAQVHGRLRAPTRKTPAIMIHVGSVAAYGWTATNTEIVVKSPGRPRRRSTLTLDALRAWVVAQGGIRAGARALGILPGTVGRYVKGRAVPAAIAAKIAHGIGGDIPLDTDGDDRDSVSVSPDQRERRIPTVNTETPPPRRSSKETRFSKQVKSEARALNIRSKQPRPPCCAESRSTFEIDHAQLMRRVAR
jgi:hypothetical protein